MKTCSDQVVLPDDGEFEIELVPEKTLNFYDNLAEDMDDSDLADFTGFIGVFEADKSSRKDWEQMYAKGLDLWA